MPVQKISSSRNSSINVRDEREFKLWVKFIASVHKEGGDIKKPIDILWNSLRDEITSVEMRCDKVLS
jgi:hypothetical protein